MRFFTTFAIMASITALKIEMSSELDAAIADAKTFDVVEPVLAQEED